MSLERDKKELEDILDDLVDAVTAWSPIILAVEEGNIREILDKTGCGYDCIYSDINETAYKDIKSHRQDIIDEIESMIEEAKKGSYD